MSIKTLDGVFTCQVILLLATADLPAKALLMNMNQYMHVPIVNMKVFPELYIYIETGHIRKTCKVELTFL